MTDSLSRIRRLPGLPMVLACLVTALLFGCGKTTPTGSVKGKVTLDGAPYTEGAVVFISPDSGQAGTADIQSDGSFTIQTPLPVGSYKVFIAPKSAGAEAGGDEPVEESLKEPVPDKYLTESTTDIVIDITEGDNDVTVAMSK
jgi:hypothetical protein